MIGSSIVDILENSELHGFDHHAHWFWISVIVCYGNFWRIMSTGTKCKGWTIVGRNHSCCGDYSEMFHLMLANSIECQMFYINKDLMSFICVVTSEPVLLVKYINKYRHLDWEYFSALILCVSWSICKFILKMTSDYLTLKSQLVYQLFWLKLLMTFCLSRWMPG